VCGVAAASRNTHFQAARYGFTWAGLAPADRASFAWRLHSLDHLVGTSENLIDRLPRKAISSVPKLAKGTPFAFVVNSFLVRTADYAVGHRD
jgi:hypothetical protein